MFRSLVDNKIFSFIQAANFSRYSNNRVYTFERAHSAWVMGQNTKGFSDDIMHYLRYVSSDNPIVGFCSAMSSNRRSHGDYGK